LAIEFRLQDCDRSVDRSTKKSWPLKWQLKLGHRIVIGVWIGQLKNLGY